MAVELVQSSHMILVNPVLFSNLMIIFAPYQRMGNKQEELESLLYDINSNPIGITEI